MFEGHQILGQGNLKQTFQDKSKGGIVIYSDHKFSIPMKILTKKG